MNVSHHILIKLQCCHFSFLITHLLFSKWRVTETHSKKMGRTVSCFDMSLSHTIVMYLGESVLFQLFSVFYHKVLTNVLTPTEPFRQKVVTTNLVNTTKFGGQWMITPRKVVVIGNLIPLLVSPDDVTVDELSESLRHCFLCLGSCWCVPTLVL